MLTVIGLDLAWTQKRNTGICIAQFDDDGSGCLLELSAQPGTPCEFAELAAAFDGDVLVAVDAPLVVGTGRTCDHALARRYGVAKASPFTATPEFLENMKGMAGPDLQRQLVNAGFRHSLPATERPSRCFIEVFPHTSHVSLFDLPERILYKKGRIAVRQSGMSDYQGYLRTMLEKHWPWAIEDPAVQTALSTESSRHRGKNLKHIEDQLDALTCAFTAWLVSTHGLSGCELFGDEEQGMIVVPIWPHGFAPIKRGLARISRHSHALIPSANSQS